jgi:flagellar motor component MotA
MSQLMREHCGKTDFKALLATLVGISIAKALPEPMSATLLAQWWSDLHNCSCTLVSCSVFSG